MAIAAVILSWNDRELTLSSVKRSLSLDLTPIVVDNGSSDNSAQEVAIAYPDVALIRNETNLGYAEASNQGLERALDERYEYVLLLNSDVTIESIDLERMAHYLDHNENVGAVAPLMYYPNRKRIWFAGLKLDLARAEAPHEQTISHKTAFPSSALTAACLLIRSAVLQQVGLFDLHYFAYFEDTDLTYRIHQAGHLLMVLPTASCIHDVSSSLGEGSARQYYYYYRNRLYFGHKFAERGTWLRAQIWVAGNLTGLAFDCVKSLVKLRWHPDRVDILRAAMRGVRDYYGGYYGPAR